MPEDKFTTVDQYVASFDPETQNRLNQIRQVIAEAAPDVEERISYNIPGFRLNGKYLIYTSAAKAHIGLYPATEVMQKHFGDRLAPLISGKATIQLKNNLPLPLDLIRDIIAFQIAETGRKAK